MIEKIDRMRVLVVFEFDEIAPESPDAERIIEAISKETQTMGCAFDAQGCWVEDVEHTVAEIEVMDE